MTTKQTAVIDLMGVRDDGGLRWAIVSLNGSQNDPEWSGSDIAEQMSSGDLQALGEVVSLAAKYGTHRRRIRVEF